MRPEATKRTSEEKTTHIPIKKTIWAVGGGKGGTGKSFVSASLAIQLSARGENVILIDADFGGPNLHTLLSAWEEKKDLGDFVSNAVQKLGSIPYDDRVHLCLKHFPPFVAEYPDSSVSMALRAIAEKLISLKS